VIPVTEILPDHASLRLAGHCRLGEMSLAPTGADQARCLFRNGTSRLSVRSPASTATVCS